MDKQQNWQQQAWNQVVPPQQPAPQQQESYYVPDSAVYAAQPYPQQPPKKGKGWIVALVAVVVVFILLAVGALSCSRVFSTSFSSSSYSSIDSVVGDTVAVIHIEGTIQYDNSNSSPEGLKAQLDKAEENPLIKAVVLRVDSGGGVATAGEEMAQYVKEFSKPIVVSSASMNASAAYEISSQSDYIFTAKTTAIGSIGTALSITDISGLYEKLGISVDNITSAESKDSSYGNRPLTEEERAYYQDLVNQINETFLQTVAEGRNMSVEEVRKLATGLTFTGMTAVENGLADKIGTLEDACAKAASLAGVSHYNVTTLRSKSSLSMKDLLGLLGSSSSQSSLIDRLKELEKNDVRIG